MSKKFLVGATICVDRPGMPPVFLLIRNGINQMDPDTLQVVKPPEAGLYCLPVCGYPQKESQSDTLYRLIYDQCGSEFGIKAIPSAIVPRGVVRVTAGDYTLDCYQLRVESFEVAKLMVTRGGRNIEYLEPSVLERMMVIHDDGKFRKIQDGEIHMRILYVNAIRAVLASILSSVA